MEEVEGRRARPRHTLTGHSVRKGWVYAPELQIDSEPARAKTGLCGSPRVASRGLPPANKRARVPMQDIGDSRHLFLSTGQATAW
jgi:hypothetical protein